MKKVFLSLTFIIFLLNMNAAGFEPQDSTGMLGDNFSLQGTLEIFKQSKSPEDFERRINSEDANINNLDLNEDGQIDYIKVIDNAEGKNHAIVLQVDINEKESQDIAVIEMEKTGEENVVVQIIGDEYLYGKEMYIEPISEVETKTKVIVVHETAPVTNTVVVNVWAWPSVRFIYGPRYRVWVSPWRWRYYPRYWKPWRPHPWRVYHHRRAHYHRHYHPVHIHRVHHAHRIYTPHRRNSVIIHKRSTTIRVNNKNGKVVKTKKTTTKVGIRTRNGKVVGGKKTTKTSTVKNRNNKVVKKKKTTSTTKVRKGKKGTKVKRTKTTTVKKKRKRRR